MNNLIVRSFGPFAAITAALLTSAFAQKESDPKANAKVGAKVDKNAEHAKAAAESDAFFSKETVVTIDLVIPPSPQAIKPLTPLMNEPRKYVKATVKDADGTYPDVGVHLRGGLGSFRGVTDKAGFTINMDKYDGTKYFHGMDKFHLVNSVQDPSYLSEWVSNEMLRLAGVPTPRIRHAIVTLNGQTKGFYFVKEGYDKFWGKRHFKNNDGNFYDGSFNDISEKPDLTGAKEDVKDYADLNALVAAANEPDHAKRFAAMEKLMDMDHFISGFCIQAILGDWDGYAFNKNNYRVYHQPEKNKIYIIPSGLDQEFGNAEAGPLVPPMKGLLGIRVFETPEGKARY